MSGFNGRHGQCLRKQISISSNGEGGSHPRVASFGRLALRAVPVRPGSPWWGRLVGMYVHANV